MLTGTNGTGIRIAFIMISGITTGGTMTGTIRPGPIRPCGWDPILTGLPTDYTGILTDIVILDITTITATTMILLTGTIAGKISGGWNRIIW